MLLRSLCFAVVMAAVVVVAQPAAAQLQNNPYSFKYSPGGVGMSVGGRQAILNDKLFDARPNVMLRDDAGGLLTLQRGPGDTAIVSVPGGNTIPGYHGRDFRGDNGDSVGVGIFNAYFTPRRDRVGGAYAVQADSADLVNSWTLRVISGGSAGYRADSPVDTWTAMVFGM